MHRIAWICVALLAAFAMPMLAQSPPAVPSGQVLYQVFRSVCLDTDASPPLVRKKLETLGGTFVRNLSIPSIPNGGDEWSLSVAGHRLQVMVITAATPEVAARGHHNDSCSINDPSRDDVSVPAIKTWLGMEPVSTTTTNGWTTYSFEYTQDGTVRHRLSPGVAAERTGYWQMDLSEGPRGNGNGATVTHRFDEHRP